MRGFPEGEPSYRVTTAGGSNPAWSKSGDRLYFRRVEGNRDRVAIWEVDVDPGAGFARRGEPRFLVENEHDTVPIRSYDVAADGRLLLRVDAEESARPQPVTKLEVVLNWFKELERRVPTGK